jgi:hypothetical protein
MCCSLNNSTPLEPSPLVWDLLNYPKLIFFSTVSCVVISLQSMSNSTRSSWHCSGGINLMLESYAKHYLEVV